MNNTITREEWIERRVYSTDYLIKLTKEAIEEEPFDHSKTDLIEEEIKLYRNCIKEWFLPWLSAEKVQEFSDRVDELETNLTARKMQFKFNIK